MSIKAFMGFVLIKEIFQQIHKYDADVIWIKIILRKDSKYLTKAVYPALKVFLLCWLCFVLW